MPKTEDRSLTHPPDGLAPSIRLARHFEIRRGRWLQTTKDERERFDIGGDMSFVAEFISNRQVRWEKVKVYDETNSHRFHISGSAMDDLNLSIGDTVYVVLFDMTGRATATNW